LELGSNHTLKWLSNCFAGLLWGVSELGSNGGKNLGILSRAKTIGTWTSIKAILKFMGGALEDLRGIGTFKKPPWRISTVKLGQIWNG